MTKKAWSARNKQDLIIEVWEYLDCESVGARELEEIQKELKEKFGAGGLASPAAIARAVADEGAVLRHPEVFECDAKWRQEHLKKQEFRNELDFTDLSVAFDSAVRLEEKRLQLQLDGDATGLKELRGMVIAARKDLELRARSKVLEGAVREQVKEISQWLTVWLQSPELFSDWLDLRRQAPEFVRKFSE
jgi:hypothetical protein